jgi:hypothetical protein
MSYILTVRVVRLLSFPSSASAEISISFKLLQLCLEWNVIHRNGKGSEVTQFPQFCESRDVREILTLITMNGVECDTSRE